MGKVPRICHKYCQLAKFPCGENGLPHQCAHWFAMTCRRRQRFCGCKAVRREGCTEGRTYARVQGRPPTVIARSVVASADTQQVLACHCEERSDVAIRTPCGSTKRNATIPGETQLFPANTQPLRICPKFYMFDRYPCGENGLPHQCAHWFAMTDLVGVCAPGGGSSVLRFCQGTRIATPVCALVRNDMQKTAALLRVQGTGSQ